MEVLGIVEVLIVTTVVVLSHFYPGATGASDRILQAEMTEEQVLEYLAGYAYNEEQGDYKEY